MIVLGIETSCDETSVALVKDGLEPLKTLTLSQIRRHAPYGGVVPEIASRAHAETLHTLTRDALTGCNLTASDLGLIAATSRPGLIGALLVGVSFANALAFAWKKPVVGVHHLEGHLYGAFMQARGQIPLPSLALLVSGGHTQLISIKRPGTYHVLGQTLDDAAGEAFDKTAKLLGLPYPGGPVIDQLAASGNAQAYAFPRAMTGSRHQFDFSFSGLKTAVRYRIEKLRRESPEALPESMIRDLTASFQRAVVETLCRKTRMAFEAFPHRSMILCGGVAANSELQRSFRELGTSLGVPVIVPDFSLCTDNATMIAGLAWHKREQAGVCIEEVEANAPAF